MRNEITSILSRRRLTPLFQPIVDMESGRLLGVEALIRGPIDSPLHAPQVLFKAAQLEGLLYELDLACRTAAIESFVAQPHPSDLLLFLNVTPAGLKSETASHGPMELLLERLKLPAAQVVIELSEQYAVEDPDLLKAAVAHYRQRGFMVALDDLGAGYSSLKLWSQLRPDIVKIDRYFVSGIHTDPTRKAFVRSLVELGRATGARVIAEGIEDVDEWRQLQQMGIRYGQGFLFARPDGVITPAENLALPALRSGQQQTIRLHQTARQLVLKQPALGREVAAREAWELMQSRRLASMAVVDDHNRPVGLLSRQRLMELFASDYGRALHARRPVTLLMDKSVVMADAHTPIDALGRLVSAEGAEEGLWHLIVTEQGRYLGVVAVRDLLRQLAEHQLQCARYANPLTELPGNVPLHQEITARLESGESFAVAYVDIDHFKPYNDHYGYARGDLVIRQLAELLMLHCGQPTTLVTHVGGDDFVVVFGDGADMDDVTRQCEQLVAAFARDLPHYLDDAERQRGGLLGYSRTGEQSFFPLPSLSVGVVWPESARCRSHLDVAEIASDAKRMAKKQGGVFLSRRRAPSAGTATPLLVDEAEANAVSL